MADALDLDDAVLDWGAHLYPEPVFPHDVYADSPLGRHLGDRLSDPDRLREQYDAAGIDGAVLSQPYYMGSDDLAATARANDALLEVVDDDERFYGLAAVPTATGGAAAAEEFERCLERGYHGGAVETRSGGVTLTDPALEPVFSVAERHGAPLLVHPKLHDTLGGGVLDDTYALNAALGREVGLMQSLCEVVHAGVLDRHPGLTLVFHHYGGNVAAMLGRLHLQLDDGRWPGRGGAAKPYRAFAEQLQSRVYVDTSGFFGYHAPLCAALEELGADRVLFATDYPFEGRSPAELAAYVETVRRHTAGEDTRRILGGTARELLATG